jgi:outer membrane protein assembly factor BamB
MKIWMAMMLAAGLGGAAADGPGDWPGFRGPGMTATAPNATLPSTWSPASNITWTAEIAGNGWSSPIVWNGTVYVTSAISGKPFKEPSPGLYGNDYIAELRAQGLPPEEVSRRVRARDNETPEESDTISYRVIALDASTGRMKWEQEALSARPFGGRHRKNTYASETPFTDGERLYVSFGQNVGLFAYTLDGTPLWHKSWEPQPIYLDFGTASSPVVHDGRVILLHDNEKASYILALDAKTGEEVWRTERPRASFLNSAWNTPFIWKNDVRTEIIATGHGFVTSYGLDGRELWRIALKGITMPTPSAFAADGMLFVGTGAQGDGANRPFFAVKPGASGDITLAETETSNAFIAWHHARASGYTPSGIAHDGRIYLVHDIGILVVINAETGKEIYKARIGGGGHTFSASPVAAGKHLYFLNEDGETFVLEAGDAYKEVARNDLDEMSLASPAIAGNALYIRTRTKLYRIEQQAAGR